MQISKIQHRITDVDRGKRSGKHLYTVCLSEMVITKTRSLKAKLTGTGNNGNVAQQGEDLWAEEGAVPNCEELVEKRL